MPGDLPVKRWNHNIHYHRLVLDAVPATARTALDVGTGNGLLAADLHRRWRLDVTGLDADANVLKSAREEDAGVTWVHGDVLSHPFERDAFDVVASVAAVHHLPDLGQTFHRLADLTAPGGVLVIVGLARSSRPVDAFYDVAGALQHRWYTTRYGLWDHSAPQVWPPPHTYADVRRVATDVLPGVTWTRLALWRYALVWTKPVA